MAHRPLRWLGLLILSALTAAALAATPGEVRAPLRLAVSATLAPLAAEVADNVRHKGGKLVVGVSGSELALEQLTAGQVDAALVSRPLREAEARLLDARVVGHDSLLLVVHERNPLERVDEATVRAIFSRQVADWHQLGVSLGGAIVPVTRHAASGTRAVLDTAFAVGRPVTAGIVELDSNLAVLLYVAADPQAIGYVSAGAYDRARQRSLGIKALRLGGITPSAQFCVGSRYPLCRPLLLVKRRSAPATRNFSLLGAAFDGASSDDLIVRHGFAPAAAAR